MADSTDPSVSREATSASPSQNLCQDWEHAYHEAQKRTSYFPYVPVQIVGILPDIAKRSGDQGQRPIRDETDRWYNLMYGHDPVYKSHDIASVSHDTNPPKSPSGNTRTTLDVSAASYFGASKESQRLPLQFQAAPTRIGPLRLLETARFPQEDTSYLKSPRGCLGLARSDHPPTQGHPPSRSTGGQAVEAPIRSAMKEAEKSGMKNKNNLITSSSTNQHKAFAVVSSRVSKRQNIPHTASEQRYRQKLTDHLECLRQKIPSLTHRHDPGETFAISTSPSKINDQYTGEPHLATLDKISNGTRISKCEILSSAVEYIGTIGRENEVLRKEAMELSARVQGLQYWRDGARRSLAVKRGTIAERWEVTKLKSCSDLARLGQDQSGSMF